MTPTTEQSGLDSSNDGFKEGGFCTFRFGNQVGLSPRFSRSMSSTLLEILLAEDLKFDVRLAVGNCLSSSRLSGTSPSQRSVRMLSSENLLSITFPPSGDFDSRVTAGLAGEGALVAIFWLSPRSS